MEQKVKIDIPVSVVVKVLLTILVFALLYFIRDLIALFFVVLILVAAFRPIVKKWGGKIHRIPAVIILLLILIILIAGFVYVVIPPLVDQSKQLVENAPAISEKFIYLKDRFPLLDRFVQSIPQEIGNISTNFISLTAGFLGGILTFITVIVLTVYLLLEDESMSHLARLAIPAEKQENALVVIRKIYAKVGDWLRAQLILGLIMGLVTFIALSIIRLPYALTVGIVAGVLEFIPILGPIIAGALAAIIALSISPLMVFLVIIITIILHQLENNLIVPYIMKKAVGLPPAIIIMAVLIGAKLLGITGAILALPVTASLYVLIQDWPKIKEVFSK